MPDFKTEKQFLNRPIDDSRRREPPPQHDYRGFVSEAGRPKTLLQEIRLSFDKRVDQLSSCLDRAREYVPIGGFHREVSDDDNLMVKVIDPVHFKEALNTQINNGLKSFKTDESLGIGNGLDTRDGHLVKLAILQLFYLSANHPQPVVINHGIFAKALKIYIGEFKQEDFEKGWRKAQAEILRLSETETRQTYRGKQKSGNMGQIGVTQPFMKVLTQK